MPKRTPEEIAQMILDNAFGDDSDIEGLSDEEDCTSVESAVPETPSEVIEIQTEENEPEPPPPKKSRQKIKKTTWKKMKFTPTAPAEDRKDSVPTEPVSPYSYFTKFITDSFIEGVCEKTNRYHFQTHGKNLRATTQEIKALIGMHIEIGSTPFRNLRLYWSKGRRYKLIADAMTFNRFCTLRNNFHLVDNLEENERKEDKFWKVRPIMNRVLNVLIEELPEPEKRLCVDEQMIPFKGRLALKQYMKGKPNPWGIKVFFLCGESGMPYNFLAYQGKTTKLPEKYNQFGLSGSVVMSLVEDRVMAHSNYRLFFDNYFTSSNLVQELLTKGIYCTGTVRANRVGSLPIKPNSELVKQGRGAMDGCTSSDNKLCLVRWNDNSLVTVLSSAYDWQTNLGQVKRYDNSTKAYVDVACPSAIIEYNKSMGGVDKLDFLLSLYRIHIKSKKWTLRVIFHFIDLAVVTSWLQYIKDCKSVGHPKSQQLSLLQFRFNIAECMIKHNTNPLDKAAVGKPRRSLQSAPPTDVRFDGIGHFPVWKDKRQRCKLSTCVECFSFVVCEKCGVSLCLNKQRNCFRDYHLAR